MTQALCCFGCDTGMATHHQNGAKSWIECECGKFVGQKIDMSDTFHVKKALEVWELAASEHVNLKEAMDKAAQEEITPPIDPVDILANTNTDVPPKKKAKK